MKQLFILFFLVLSLSHAAQIPKSTYKIVQTLVDKAKTKDKTQLVFKFISPSGQPAKSHIKLSINNDTLIPTVNENGIYTTFLDSGIYKLHVCVPYWYDVQIDSTILCKNEKVKITIQFQARRNKIPGIIY